MHEYSSAGAWFKFRAHAVMGLTLYIGFGCPFTMWPSSKANVKSWFPRSSFCARASMARRTANKQCIGAEETQYIQSAFSAPTTRKKNLFHPTRTAIILRHSSISIIHIETQTIQRCTLKDATEHAAPLCMRCLAQPLVTEINEFVHAADGRERANREEFVVSARRRRRSRVGPGRG